MMTMVINAYIVIPHCSSMATTPPSPQSIPNSGMFFTMNSLILSIHLTSQKQTTDLLLKMDNSHNVSLHRFSSCNTDKSDALANNDNHHHTDAIDGIDNDNNAQPWHKQQPPTTTARMTIPPQPYWKKWFKLIQMAPPPVTHFYPNLPLITTVLWLFIWLQLPLEQTMT